MKIWHFGYIGLTARRSKVLTRKPWTLKGKSERPSTSDASVQTSIVVGLMNHSWVLITVLSWTNYTLIMWQQQPWLGVMSTRIYIFLFLGLNLVFTSQGKLSWISNTFWWINQYYWTRELVSLNSLTANKPELSVLILYLQRKLPLCQDVPLQRKHVKSNWTPKRVK